MTWDLGHLRFQSIPWNLSMILKFATFWEGPSKCHCVWRQWCHCVWHHWLPTKGDLLSGPDIQCPVQQKHNAQWGDLQCRLSRQRVQTEQQPVSWEGGSAWYEYSPSAPSFMYTPCTEPAHETVIYVSVHEKRPHFVISNSNCDGLRQFWEVSSSPKLFLWVILYSTVEMNDIESVINARHVLCSLNVDWSFTYGCCRQAWLKSCLNTPAIAV